MSNYLMFSKKKNRFELFVYIQTNEVKRSIEYSMYQTSKRDHPASHMKFVISNFTSQKMPKITTNKHANIHIITSTSRTTHHIFF